MKMKEFAEIVKKSHIAGNNKKRIIYQLLQALGAKPAIGESAMGLQNKISDQSPSDSTIQKWLNDEDSKPGVSRYFPKLKVENEEGAHEFLKRTPKKDQWIELRDLFKEWHNNNQNADEVFYINTETDDFNTFSVSFWSQFVSFFDSLRMWDGAEGQYPEAEGNRKNCKSSIANEIIGVFHEKFRQYKIYEFIPKDIKNVIDSLYIYREIRAESAKLVMHENSISDCDAVQKSKKMYCKWFPDYDNFFFGAVVGYNDFWKLQIPGGCILLKFSESFEYDMMLTNTWMTGSFKYAVVDSGLKDEQFNEEELSWKGCQGEIIIIDIGIPTKMRESANEGIPAKARILVDENISVTESITVKATALVKENTYVNEGCPIIEDCYMLIDGMLEQDSLIDEFIAVISEKIIKKYEDVTFDDNSRLLYNDIKQYRKLLKRFKKYLHKFRDLKKEKSQYLSDQALIETFGDYLSFSDFKSAPKPDVPFSECYLNPEEARKVETELYRSHGSLKELYAEILSYERDCTA